MPDKKLVIAGAGGCGREVLQWALAALPCQNEWHIAGFIDDNPNALDNYDTGYTLLGGISSWQPQHDEVFVCAIGSPDIKKRVAQALQERGAQFASIIHPTAIIATTATLGMGVVLSPFTTVSADAVVGDHVFLNLNTSIGHDARVGCYSTLSSYVDVTGFVTVGDGVFAGSHVSIVPNIRIGENAFLCAGSVIMTHVKQGQKMLGNPARKFAL